MLEAGIAIAIVIIIVLVWYFYVREEESSVDDKSTVVEKPSASEVAATVIANAEAPKGVVSSSSASVSVILPTTSADVAKSASAIKTLVTTSTKDSSPAPTEKEPIVQPAPVTSSLPAGSATASPSELSSMLPTYTFHQGMAFGGNDLVNTGLTDNVTKLASWCDANTKCKGFTTDAWMKSTIVPQDKWYKWSDDATKGLYIKK